MVFAVIPLPAPEQSMSSDSKDPIADALNTLHENETGEERKQPKATDPEGDLPDAGEEELDLGNYADDLDGSTQDLTELTMGQGPSGSEAMAGRSRPAPRARLRRPTKLHHTGVKICLVIGMLLLIPALWAVAVLVGLNVPMSHRSSAFAMALFMLISWPVAGALIGGAIYFSRHFAKLDAMFDAAEAENRKI